MARGWASDCTSDRGLRRPILRYVLLPLPLLQGGTPTLLATF
jgi:hypothetical protein